MCKGFSLWSIFRTYGIPSHVVAVIKNFHTDFSCSVGSSDLSFLAKSGVRQGCITSGLLFNIAIDWVLLGTPAGRRRGIRWTLTSVLEDPDDIVLLSHFSSDMQEKTERVKLVARQVDGGDGSEHRCASANYNWTTTTYCHTILHLSGK